MRSKLIKCYYCDHCSKRLMQRPAMVRHEIKCVRNIKRVCALCECDADTRGLAALAVEFRAKLERLRLLDEIPIDPFPLRVHTPEESAEIEKIDEQLLDSVEQCPACALAIIHASGTGWHLQNYKELSRQYVADCYQYEHY